MYRISLRQLLIFVTVVGLALVSLKYASFIWQVIVGSLAMIIAIAATVAAIVDRGNRQAFAVGVAVTMLAYAIAVKDQDIAIAINRSRGTIQEDPRVELLPTTSLANYLYQVVADEAWVDSATSKIISRYSATNSAPPTSGFTPGAEPLYRILPDRVAFIFICHCWFALLFAYLGGNFARFVYRRRMKEHAAPANE
jgi:hypothetical protein